LVKKRAGNVKGGGLKGGGDTLGSLRQERAMGLWVQKKNGCTVRAWKTQKKIVVVKNLGKKARKIRRKEKGGGGWTNQEKVD